MQRGTYEYQSDFARKYFSQGRQEALLDVLETRGLQVDAEARERIQACTDFAQLKRWLRLAVTARSVQELFEPQPAPNL